MKATYLADFAPFLLLGAPAILLLLSFLPSRFCGLHVVTLSRSVEFLTVFSAFAALFGAVCLAISGPISHRFFSIGPLQTSVYFDALSATLLLLVSFIGAVVARFSRGYMAGEADFGRFFKWLGVTTGAALLLVIAGNLVLFTLAWMAMSLSLHQLLVFYPNRAGAVLAARKKFIVSRIGDTCLLGVIFLAFQTFGTWDFAAIFTQAQNFAGLPASERPAQLPWMAILLVLGAMLKSAQFPFHSWLPETMETPTPVSALMHAGIINAGGFLVIRLSPLVSLSPFALDTLAVVGAITAVFAAVVMTTQTSVKRALAFSTVAQMGFMMLQCGLGAFSVAVLHIVAHSLYKAHAFLASGSIIANAKALGTAPEKAAPSPLLPILALGASGAILLLTALVFGATVQKEPGALLLGAVLWLALTHFLINLWRAFTPALLAWGTAICALVGAAYFALHLVFHAILASATVAKLPARAGVETGLLLVVGVVFALLLAAPHLLRGWHEKPLVRAFYVHASNGFYLHTLANRLVSRS